MKTLALCVLTLVASCIASRYVALAQAYLFDHFDSRDGLPSNWITCIVQDKQGFIWTGGDGGISVYDGETFRSMGVSEGLPVPHVWSLAQGSPGTMYAGVHTGDLCVVRDGAIRIIPLDTASKLTVSSVVADDNGVIWCGTTRGLYRVFQDSASFFSSPADSSTVWFLHRTRDGTLIVGGEKGVWLISKGFTTPQPLKVGERTVTCVVESAEGTLWFGTAEGAVIKVTGMRVLQTLSTNLGEFRSIALDQSGHLWIASNRGLVQLPTKMFPGTTPRLHTTSNGLRELDINVCYVDREDNVWIGGRGQGLSKLAYRTLTRFSFPGFHPDVINRAIVSDERGHLFAVTDLGIREIWKARDGAWQSRLHEVFAPRLASAVAEVGGTLSIEYDPRGHLWVALPGGGLLRFSISPRAFEASQLALTHTMRPGKELPAGRAFGVMLDGHNQLLYNLRNGPLVQIDASTRKIRAQYPVMGDQIGSTIQALCPTPEGTLWVGTFADGIAIFTWNNGGYSFDRKLTVREGLSSNRIRTIVRRRNGEMWIGTRFDGINIYHRGKVRSLTMKDGLMSNAVWRMVEDEEGRVWIGTSVGVQSTDPDGEQLFTHPRLSGFQVAGIGVVPQHRGIWRTGAGELMIIERTRSDEPNVPPLVAMSGLRVNGIDKQMRGDLTFSYAENYCVLRYAGLTFRDERHVRFRYRLLGFDTVWQEPTHQRTVTFASLPSGSYRFEVKAIAADGRESTVPASLEFTILPPWYRSPWSIGVYIVLGSVSVLLYIKLKTRKLERRSRELEGVVAERTAEVVDQRNRLHDQAERLREMDALKSHFFTNISHEFRTPLTVILGHLERLMQRSPGTAEYEVMDRNARRLLQLINQLLDLSKLEAGGMTLRATKTDIVAFTRRVTSFFTSFAHHKGIRLTLNGIAVSESNMFPPIFTFLDQDKIEKVVSNLLSNALKFTPRGGCVDLTISSDTDSGGKQYVEIAVADTGPGISSTSLPYVFDRFYQADGTRHTGVEGTGVGLALVKELVELHHGSVRVASEVGKGTTFTIRLPLGSSHLDEGEIAETGEETLLREILAPPDVGAPVPDIEETLLPEDAERILIVEDNADLRSFLREQLEAEYAVIESDNGGDGVRKAEQFIPDLIISDIMMPEMDGYRLCEAVKRNDKTNHIPVILLTAKATTENKLEGLETGADDYLTKPFNAQELKLRVRNLIQIRRQLREKFTGEMLLKPASVTVPSIQRQFLEKVTAVIENHLSDETFSVEILAGEVGLSRSQLHRKLKSLTNRNPNELIRSFRLHRAAELIRQNAGSLAEIAYQVGFGSQAHFTRSFGEEFGMSPSDYRKTSSAK